MILIYYSSDKLVVKLNNLYFENFKFNLKYNLLKCPCQLPGTLIWQMKTNLDPEKHVPFLCMSVVKPMHRSCKKKNSYLC